MVIMLMDVKMLLMTDGRSLRRAERASFISEHKTYRLDVIPHPMHFSSEKIVLEARDNGRHYSVDAPVTGSQVFVLCTLN